MLSPEQSNFFEIFVLNCDSIRMALMKYVGLVSPNKPVSLCKHIVVLANLIC